ncbi:hypothetical protein J1605_019545 [Eschrichtius robustus]|uniref:Uncharacterized protein n=1 Tax=Eschrichtius robustus TaxID=9764 RepID=A0AB34HPB6_ESCRO|nr:hypothetical protein J1605_019545 [Eschrichtius robustus]
MRAILGSYDSELTPAEYSPQLTRRMREAEDMVQKVHAHSSEMELPDLRENSGGVDVTGSASVTATAVPLRRHHRHGGSVASPGAGREAPDRGGAEERPPSPGGCPAPSTLGLPSLPCALRTRVPMASCPPPRPHRPRICVKTEDLRSPSLRLGVTLGPASVFWTSLSVLGSSPVFWTWAIPARPSIGGGFLLSTCPAQQAPVGEGAPQVPPP